ncbi:GIY-YIG nuclease family protein [Candidatus Falkowbacteria bacterium]|nr:GIY-YIG nuclease family protein [Candidatus Falkowbacteria bacterium]
MFNKYYYVYIMTNKLSTVLYVGVTNDLKRRVWEHKSKFNDKSFTTKYNICKLVYYEIYESPRDAIGREKQMKGGSRKDKIDLIKKGNEGFADMSKEWYL